MYNIYSLHFCILYDFQSQHAKKHYYFLAINGISYLSYEKTPGTVH